MARHKIERRGQRRVLNLKSTFFGKHSSTLSVHHPNLLFIPCIAPPTKTFTKTYFYYINSILRRGSSQNRKKESWQRKPKSKLTFPDKHFPESLFIIQIFFSSPILVLRENNSYIHINILLAYYCMRWTEEKKREEAKKKILQPVSALVTLS